MTTAGDGDTTRKPTVLVVDDEASIRETLRFVFERDFEVLTASTGMTALDIVRGRRVDVALLDVRMAGLDGLETAERLRAIDEDVAVIFLSAARDAATARRAMDGGAFDYLTKPFDAEALIALVGRAVESVGMRRAVSAEAGNGERANER